MAGVQDHLQSYGTGFQFKVIANLLLTNNKTNDGNDFLPRVVDTLNPDLFESDANRFIAKTILNYYKKYRKVPSIDVFKLEIADLDDFLKETIVQNLREIFHVITSPDLSYVRDEFLNFLLTQQVKNALFQSVDLIKNGEILAIKEIMEKSFKVADHAEDDHSYIEDIEERLLKTYREGVIPTPWPIINDLTSGGLGAGDLGIIVGLPGSGKSWLLTDLGAHAIKAGKKVIHISLELKDKYAGRRYDSVLTGIVDSKLSDHIEEVRSKIMNSVFAKGGALKIKYFPTKGAGVNTLKMYINSKIVEGFVPDMIIVDYGDILSSDNAHAISRGSYFEVGEIFEMLRGMAGEFNIPVWTASQSRKSAADNEIITGEDMTESYKKLMIADFVLSMSRKTEDKMSNTARFYVIKNRYGADGWTFPGRFDASIGSTEMFMPDSNDGSRVRKDMEKNNEVVRQQLSLRFKDLMISDNKEDKNLEGFED